MPDVAFSIITVCKNRLTHLKQTLPLMCQQSLAEVIVVDYGCSEQTGDWVEAHYPAVKVVRVTDDPGFCLARARNLGAQRAVARQLFFVDADILLQQDVCAYVNLLPEKPRDCLFVDGERHSDKRGTMLMPARLFHAAGGFDEAINIGWGGEDSELSDRLLEQGAAWLYIPADYMQAIPHSDAERQFEALNNQAIDRKFLVQVHISYRRIARDLRLLGVETSVKQRQELLQGIIRQLQRFHQTQDDRDLLLNLEVNAAEKGLYQHYFPLVHRSLVYRLDVAKRADEISGQKANQ